MILKKISKNKTHEKLTSMQKVKFTNCKVILRLIVGDCCLSRAKSLLHWSVIDYQVTFGSHSGCVHVIDHLLFNLS